MKYFKDCNTIEEVKQLYKQLAKQHHPDLGSDTAIMQQASYNTTFIQVIKIL